MRIGDLDYLNGTTESENPKTHDGARHQDTPTLTEQQRKRYQRRNWWHYHKWYVICGILLAGIIINLTGSYLGWWTKAPDFQIAYIGSSQLPPETISALEQAFTSIGSDFNGDGEVIVQINQYLRGLPATDSDAISYEYASEISLIGDISECESYFFLMEDPKQFQMDFQLLALPDGSCPADTDYTVEDKVIPWSACPLLSEMDLGTYSIALPGSELSGDSQELFSGLSIGRRCFFQDDTTKYADKCGELWNLLCGDYFGKAD